MQEEGKSLSLFLQEAPSLSQFCTSEACHGFHCKSLALGAESPISLQMTEQTPQPSAQGGVYDLPSIAVPSQTRLPCHTKASRQPTPRILQLELCVSCSALWLQAHCLNPSTTPASCAIRSSTLQLRFKVIITDVNIAQCRIHNRRPIV